MAQDEILDWETKALEAKQKELQLESNRRRFWRAFGIVDPKDPNP